MYKLLELTLKETGKKKIRKGIAVYSVVKAPCAPNPNWWLKSNQDPCMLHEAVNFG